MADFKIDPDYVEVSQRVADLYEKYPDAVLEGSWTIEAFGSLAFIVYTAKCWRKPDDPRPSVGIAMEEIPGRTPYTKGSEIQNAETSAWGRAIVAAGASQSKKIASANEVRAARAREQAPEPSRPAPASPDRVEQIKEMVLENDLTEWVKDQGFPWPWADAACDAIEAEARRKATTPPVEPVMTRAESKANEAAKADAEPTHCPECGAGPLEPHAEGCSIAPF